MPITHGAPPARAHRRDRRDAHPEAAALRAALMLGALLAGTGGTPEQAPCAAPQAVRGEIYWPAD